jgi:hypothetical protein
MSLQPFAVPIFLSPPEVLAEALTDYANIGAPLPEDLADYIEEAPIGELCPVVLDSALRVELRRPSPALVNHAQRAAKRPRKGKYLHLVDLFRWKMKTGSSRPASYRVLADLRRQWRRAISQLPGCVHQRMEHVFQVQACPDIIRREMLKMFAICFTINGNPRLPRHPVAMESVEAQFIEFRSNGRFIDPILQTARLVPDLDTSGFTLRREASWNFGLAVVTVNSEGRGFPLIKSITFDNAIAMHEACEMAALRIHKPTAETPEIFWPELLIRVEPAQLESHIRDEGNNIAAASADEVVRAVHQLVINGFDRDRTIAAMPIALDAAAFNRAFWLRDKNISETCLLRLKDRASTLDTFDGIQDALGDETWSLSRAIIMSTFLEDRDGSPFLPVRFACGEASYKLPAAKMAVWFNEMHFGRDGWEKNGSPVRHDTYSSPQVIVKLATTEK